LQNRKKPVSCSDQTFTYERFKKKSRKKSKLNWIMFTSAPVFAMCIQLMNERDEFKCDRTSTCDAPRSGPIEAATPEFIVHDIVLTDR